jgi:hypothetical protein
VTQLLHYLQAVLEREPTLQEAPKKNNTENRSKTQAGRGQKFSKTKPYSGHSAKSNMHL